MELSVVSSERTLEPQIIFCTATGFYPTIEWLPKSVMKDDASHEEVTMQVNGHVKAFSKIKVPLKEWNTGVEYICQVKDRQKIFQKNISDCAGKKI